MEVRRGPCTAVTMRKRRERTLQTSPLSDDQACCFHPPFIECYVVQAFSITSDLFPKLMLKITNQIVIRKVCTVIQSLQSHRPDHYSSHSQDHEKHPSLHTCPWRINVVNVEGYVERQKLLGIDTSRYRKARGPVGRGRCGRPFLR